MDCLSINNATASSRSRSSAVSIVASKNTGRNGNSINGAVTATKAVRIGTNPPIMGTNVPAARDGLVQLTFQENGLAKEAFDMAPSVQDVRCCRPLDRHYGEPPEKKLKVFATPSPALVRYDVVATVISLNNRSGMDFLLLGDYGQAEICFLQAMNFLNDYCLRLLDNATALSSLAVRPVPLADLHPRQDSPNPLNDQRSDAARTNDLLELLSRQLHPLSAASLTPSSSAVPVLVSNDSDASTDTSADKPHQPAPECGPSADGHGRNETSKSSLDATASSAAEDDRTPPVSGDTASAPSTYHYDEGMYVYRDALPLTADICLNTEDEIEAIGAIKFTLLYNIAQTCLRRESFDKAERWLHQALIEYPLATGNRSDSLTLIKLLHNIGYSAFRRNHNVIATQSYQNALSIARSIGSTEHIAASLNCVAVMKFVQHPQAEATSESARMLVQSCRLYKQLASELQQRAKHACTRNDSSGLHTDRTKDSDSANASIHCTMATVLNNLGRVHYFNRDYDKALEVYMECLQIRQRYLSNDASLDVAVTIYNMGQTYHQLNKSNEALECYKLFRSMIRAKLPFESRDVAIVYKCMAELYHERNDLEQCHDCLDKALRSARACLGPFHTEVASILNKIGNACYELGRYDDAMRHYKQGLKIERVILGPHHAHTIVTMVNIAHIHKQQKDYRRALSLYSRVRNIQACKFAELEAKLAKPRCANIDEATSLSNMGLMQYNLKDYRGAFESYQEALRIRRDYYKTEDHPDIASTLNSIGLTLFKQKMYSLAQECFAQCLKIRRTVLGENHRDVAVVWYNMGTIYFEQGDDDEAVECYEETLRIEEVALGECHSDVVMTLQHIGQVYQQIGRFEDALRYLELAKQRELTRSTVEGRRRDARSRRNRSKPGSDPESPTKWDDVLCLAKIYNLIGNLHLQQGQVDEMMEAFSKALRLIDSYRAAMAANGVANGTDVNSLLIAGYNFYGLSKTNPPAAAVA